MSKKWGFEDIFNNKDFEGWANTFKEFMGDLESVKKDFVHTVENIKNEFKEDFIDFSNTIDDLSGAVDDLTEAIDDSKKEPQREKSINKGGVTLDSINTSKETLDNMRQDILNKVGLGSNASGNIATINNHVAGNGLTITKPLEIGYLHNPLSYSEPKYMNKKTGEHGYHTKVIQKGVYGQISKIREEVEELEDAHQQGNKIMEINELADIIGAVKAYSETMGINLSDLIKMAQSTERAFKTGERK